MAEMSTIIKSGKSGVTAEVGNDNRLWTNAKSYAGEEVAAQNGEAFIWHGECHLAAATSGALMYFKSTDVDKKVHITRIYIDPFSLSDNIKIYQVKNPTTVSNGADVTSTNITNKNFSSGQTMSGTLKISNGSSDMTYSGGTKYHSFIARSLTSTQRNMLGTNVLDNNDEILWGWETMDGVTPATNGEIISLSVNIYRRPVE